SARGIDYRFQICSPLIERGRAAAPLAHAASPLVVADEPPVGGEELVPVPPDGTFPLVFEMRQPVGGLDDEGTGSRFGPCEARPVRRVDVANVLAKPRRAAHPLTGTFVSRTGPQFQPNRDNAPMGAARATLHSHRHTGGNAVLKRLLFFAFGVVSYLIFLATFLCAIAFVGGFAVPSRLDGPLQTSLPAALAIDCVLLTIFAVQHSVMARRWFKERWTQIVPWTIERSTFVLCASLALLLLF